MIPPGAVALLQSLAGSNMDETWRCQRTTKVFDNKTGKTTVSTETVYDGPANLFEASLQSRLVVEAGASSTLTATVLELPIKVSAALRIGDVFECTANRHDPAMVGVQVRITSRPLAGKASSHQYRVEREVPS
jgi:hypothetical protein